MTLASRRLCLVAAVLYSTWVIAPLLDPQLDPWRSYASEYFVAQRPAATLLRTTDGLAGVLLVVISVLAYARIRTVWRGLPQDRTNGETPRPSTSNRRVRVAVRVWCAATALTGLATVVDAINPMTCAPSLDVACAAGDKAGTLPLQHELHTASSATAGVALIVAMAACLALTDRTDILVRLSSVVGIVTIAVSGLDALDPWFPSEGITQRVSMVVIVVWLVVAAGVPVVDRLRSNPSGETPESAKPCDSARSAARSSP